MYVHVCVHVHVCTHACVYVCACVCACVLYAWVHVRMYKYHKYACTGAIKIMKFSGGATNASRHHGRVVRRVDVKKIVNIRQNQHVGVEIHRTCRWGGTTRQAHECSKSVRKEEGAFRARVLILLQVHEAEEREAHVRSGSFPTFAVYTSSPRARRWPIFLLICPGGRHIEPPPRSRSLLCDMLQWFPGKGGTERRSWSVVGLRDTRAGVFF